MCRRSNEAVHQGGLSRFRAAAHASILQILSATFSSDAVVQQDRLSKVRYISLYLPKSQDTPVFPARDKFGSLPAVCFSIL